MAVDSTVITFSRIREELLRGKGLQTAFNVMGDVIINTTAMQYGGFTVAEVDFSTKTIKSAKVAEKVLDGVKARFKLEAENEFMIEQKQKIDSYFSICTTE